MENMSADPGSVTHSLKKTFLDHKDFARQSMIDDTWEYYSRFN